MQRGRVASRQTPENLNVALPDFSDFGRWRENREEFK
jgi:hypothetical protein